MALQQVFQPAAFTAVKTWDVRDGISNIPVAPSTAVGGLAAPYYLLDGGVGIRINDAGPVVRRRVCSDVDIRCNFWDGDAVLVVRDPTPAVDATEAPLRLRLSKGLRALGAWLGITPLDAFDASFFGQPMWGHVWVALESDPTTPQLFTADGATGTVLAPGSAMSAPFVGARATGADRIIEVRFDASLMGNRRYRELVLSELSYEV